MILSNKNICIGHGQDKKWICETILRNENRIVTFTPNGWQIKWIRCYEWKSKRELISVLKKYHKIYKTKRVINIPLLNSCYVEYKITPEIKNTNIIDQI